MFAISVKYLGPTNARGSRLKATVPGLSVTVPWEYAFNDEQNYDAAAHAIVIKAMERSGGAGESDHHFLGGYHTGWSPKGDERFYVRGAPVNTTVILPDTDNAAGGSVAFIKDGYYKLIVSLEVRHNQIKRHYYEHAGGYASQMEAQALEEALKKWGVGGTWALGWFETRSSQFYVACNHHNIVDIELDGAQRRRKY